MSKYKAILFDLDGTLLDTVPGLARSMNEILVKHNFPERSIQEYKVFIGNGIKALVEQAAPPQTDANLLEQMYIEKTKLYETYWKTGTQLFPGIDELLTELENRGVILTIFSNKEDFFTQQIVASLLGKWKFAKVIGRTQSIPKKPDPTGWKLIIDSMSILKQQWLAVGDKDADIETAQNLNIDSAWVSWGYQGNQPLGATYRVEHPSSLMRFF